MSATFTTPELSRPVGLRRRVVQLFWSVLFPAAAAALALLYLVPPHLGSASSGVAQALARFASESPLVVLLVLFIAISETAHYWRSRFFGLPRVALRPWTRRRLGMGVGLAVVIALLLRTFVAEVYRVTSSSMLPDISVGDRLLVSKSAYGVRIPGTKLRLGARTPKRGDIVVFMGDAQDGHGRVALVKRVMGLPGDTVEFRGGLPYINGWPVPSCDAGTYQAFVRGQGVRGHLTVEYLDNHSYLTVLNYGDKNAPRFEVPPGQIFVVGDDRGMSSDSRFWNEGHGAGVPIDDVVGRVTRLLVGGRPDGRFELSHFFAPVGLDLHVAGLDLKNSRQWIADCLKDPSPSVPPTPSR